MFRNLSSALGAVLSKTLTLSIFLFPEIACVTAQGKNKDPLIEVYSSQEIITGVTTTASGRVFFEYPHLDGSSGTRIGELGKDGKVTSFPNAAWNEWGPGRPTEHTFVRTNSMRIGPDGLLWVVDIYGCRWPNWTRSRLSRAGNPRSFIQSVSTKCL